MNIRILHVREFNDAHNSSVLLVLTHRVSEDLVPFPGALGISYEIFRYVRSRRTKHEQAHG